MVCSFPSNDRGLVYWMEAYRLRSGQTAFTWHTGTTPEANKGTHIIKQLPQNTGLMVKERHRFCSPEKSHDPVLAILVFPSANGLENNPFVSMSYFPLNCRPCCVVVSQNLTSLRKLNLDGNQISRVPAALPPSLVELKMNRNMLSALTPHSFTGTACACGCGCLRVRVRVRAYCLYIVSLSRVEER